ncbi:hypothetical protein EDB84DRAFT_1437385 [Lactarius hengduanensis]|nr:hypothetical protein EDB84DRAFT_1437385 [Lactarius hengduanensis]
MWGLSKCFFGVPYFVNGVSSYVRTGHTGCGMDQHGLPTAYHIVSQRELEESQGGFGTGSYRDHPELICSVRERGLGLASSYGGHVGQLRVANATVIAIITITTGDTAVVTDTRYFTALR